MAGAPQAVRDVARIVSPPLAEDGAAEAIERYALARGGEDGRRTTDDGRH